MLVFFVPFAILLASFDANYTQINSCIRKLLIRLAPQDVHRSEQALGESRLAQISTLLTRAEVIEDKDY